METFRNQDAINRLKKMRNTNVSEYIFRGHADCSWQLQPGIFRDKTRSRHPTIISKAQLNAWINSDTIHSTIINWFDSRFIGSHQCYRLGYLVYFLLCTNYELSQFYQNDVEGIIIHPSDRVHLTKPEFWQEQQNFNRIFCDIFTNSISYYRFDNGQIITEGTVLEDITGYEQSLAQHYGAPTAAMDWTTDPYIALHFALDRKNCNLSRKPFCIWAYQELKAHPGNPILIEQGKPNKRLNAQKGLFTSFRYALYYFLKHGNFPTMLNFITEHEHKDFLLQQYIIEPDFKEGLALLLNEAEINDKILHLYEHNPFTT